MLILTRKVNESVVIGDDITLTVVGIRGNQVRIGVTAPREVPVFREEILAEKKEPVMDEREDETVS